jgi:hypothetical protein
VEATSLPTILLAEISLEKRTQTTTTALPVTNLESMEQQMIIKALETSGGHRGLAAEQLGISRRTLTRKLHEYNITPPVGDRGRTMGTMGAAQQKLYRAKTRFLVRLQTSEGVEADVTALNLSTGGLGVDGLSEPQRFGGLLGASFLLPEREKLIQAKMRLVWADGAGRAGLRFIAIEPALLQEIQHWTAHQMKENGWELPVPTI